jgi:UDP-N-acetylglucosamine 2-epimerase
MERFEPVLTETAPDWLVVYGDVNSTMATALVAAKLGVRIAHVEAGLRSGDRHHPYPEEANRRMIGAVADLHLAPTAWAADNLRREGVPEADLAITGNTTVDALLAVLAHPELERLGALPGEPLPAGREIVLITLHRRESWLEGTGQSGPGSALEEILGALASAARRHPERLFVYPVHPNPRVREPAERVLGTAPNVRLLEPLAYFPFVRLMARARVIVTDSGGIQEEAPSLGIPALVLRRTTERPEGLAAAANRLVGTDPETILAALDAALSEPPAAPERRPYPNPFGDGRAAHRVARAILTRFGLCPEPLELAPAIGGGTAERPSSQVLAGATP